MKKMDHWLNTITILIIVIAMGFFNLAWLKHKSSNSNYQSFTIITASILFSIFIIGIIITKQGRKK